MSEEKEEVNKRIFESYLQKYGLHNRLINAAEGCSKLIQAISHLIIENPNTNFYGIDYTYYENWSYKNFKNGTYSLSYAIADLELIFEELKYYFKNDYIISDKKEKMIR